MGRPRKVIQLVELKKDATTSVEENSAKELSTANKQIATLSVDFSSESLNDMARKINEIIESLNK